ncbi:MAG: shikimate dehydrogenase [Geobacteraceae bacterium]|nr:shikimate dehydrogenase [Geobacteraceae bacterium]NTW81168.1 shikimate dehydrogenase [Geobacteraceae bacterium]
MPNINGKTRVVAIIGNPIRHTLSPVIQNAAFAASGLDYVYVPFLVSPDNLEQAVVGLKALGVCGFNVTIPHKTAIIPFLDRLDESAESAGAVNTVKLCGASLIGYNTDGDGLVDSLSRDLDFSPGAEQILVIGAGGAARGAIAALCRSGAKKILVCNRSLENALTLVKDMIVRYPEACIEVINQNQLNRECLGLTSLLLNTTSLGMNGERIENINLSDLPADAKVYDMVYSCSVTPLVKEASENGFRAVNGLGMLVAQGERGFEIWTGQKPPEDVMRKALVR